MATKRTHVDIDPDYEDVSEHQNKRQRVLEQDAKLATRLKIENIVKKEFSVEEQNKEMEIDLIDQRLHQARLMMDRLRACIVANYYSSAGQSKLWQANRSDPQQVPPIHPAVKNHLGKTPKNYTPPGGAEMVKTEPVTNDIGASGDHSNSTLLSTVGPVKPEKSNDVKEVVDETGDMEQLGGRTTRFKVKKRIIVGNVSKYIPVEHREENDQPTHKWMVYVRGSKDQPHIEHFVKKVWFLLHPSYRPNDLVEVSQPPFHLTRRGWGEFPVRVQLHFKDPRNKRLDIIHQLKLDRTYTGLQTLGAETVVDVELERDVVQTKSTVTKETSKQSSSKVVNGNQGQSSEVKQEPMDVNFTIKEQTTPKKDSAMDKKLLKGEITPLQLKSQGNGANLVSLSNNENCLTPKGKRASSECGISDKVSAVGRTSESVAKSLSFALGSSSDSSSTNLSSKLVVGNLLVNSHDGKLVGTPQVGTITPGLLPSPASSTLLMSGASGVQVVVGGLGSITTSGVPKPMENKKPTATGKSLLRKMYDAKSTTAIAKPNLPPPSPIQTGITNRAASPSSFVLHGLGSLSGTVSGVIGNTGAKPMMGTSGAAANIIVAGPTSVSKTPAFHIVTSNQRDSSGVQGQMLAPPPAAAKTGVAPAAGAQSAIAGHVTTPPQTLYVRCKDSSGNIFLVPHHLLKQVSTTAAKTSVQNTSSTSATIPTPPQTTTTSTVAGVTSLLPRFSQTEQKTLPSMVSSCSATSSKVSPLPPSVFIKVESQPSTAGPALSSSKAESQKLCLVPGNSQRPQGAGSVVDLKKPSTVFHVKVDPAASPQSSPKKVQEVSEVHCHGDHVYSVNNSPVKNARDSVNSTHTATNASKSHHRSSDNIEVNTEKDQIADLRTANVGSQGQLKVTPHGLKAVAGTSQEKSPHNTPQKLTTLIQSQGQRPATVAQSPGVIPITTTTVTTLQASSTVTSVVTSREGSITKELSSVLSDTNKNSRVQVTGKKGEAQSLLTGKSVPVFNDIGSIKQSLSTTTKVKSLLPNADGKPLVTLLNGQSLDQGRPTANICVGGSTGNNSLLSLSTTRVLTSMTSQATPCQTISSSSQKPTMTFTSSQVQEVKHTLNSRASDVSGKTMLATIGKQKLLIHMPELNSSKVPSNHGMDMSHQLDKSLKNKYFISDDASSSFEDKKIISLRKKKCYETIPYKLVEVSPIRVSDYHDLLSLIKAAVNRHPIICETVDRTVHPYCARTIQQWLSWNVGKRRASEWQRASSARRFLLKHLHGERSFKGQLLWTTKQIMIWCRLHVYSPHFLEKTMHPSPVELSADSSMLGKRYTSTTDSDSIMTQIQDVQNSSKSEIWDEEVDIVSVEPPKVKVKAEINTEPVCCDPDILPPSQQACFVQDLSTKIGVRFEPSCIDSEVQGSVAEDMIFSAMKSFMSDVLRETYAMKVNMGRYADSVGVGDVYRTLGRLRDADFLTNHHLGVPPQVMSKSSTTNR